MAVTLVAPDGRQFDVDESRVEEALAAGWTRPTAAPPAPAQAPAAPETDATSAPAAPEDAAQGDMVPMRAPDGRQFDVHPTQLQAALDAGWKTDTTLLQKVRTTLEGGARGLSLGASDLVQAGGAGLGTALGEALAEDVGPGAIPRAAGPGLGAPVVAPEAKLYDEQAAQQALQGIRTRVASDPELAAGAEVVGAVAPALLTGGGSTAAQAARFTPAGASSLLAARVQAALTKKVAGEAVEAAAKQGLKAALTRVGGVTAAGATEAAVQSATRRVVDDLVEQNFDISAERMLEGMGGVIEDAALGALVGGTVGGAIEGGEALYKGGKGLLGRAAQKVTEEAPQPTLSFDLSLEPAQAVEEAGPLLSKDLPTLADNSNSGIVRAARGAAETFDDDLATAGRQIRDDYDELLKTRAQVDNVANLGAKREGAERIVAPDDVHAYPVDDAAITKQLERLNGNTDTYELRNIPIDDVDVPAVWAESKIAPIRQALDDGAPLPPIRADRGPTGKYAIDDGIHRVNAAREAGYTHVPAIVPKVAAKTDSAVIAAARRGANEMLDELDVALNTATKIDGFEAALQHGGGLTAFKRVEMALNEARRLMNQKLDEGYIGEAFMIGDDLKRIFGQAQKSQNSIAKHKMRDLYERVLQPSLEDESTWGQLAANQKRVNPTWTESIRRDSDDLMQQFWRESGEAAPDPFELQTKSNSRAIDGLLKGLGGNDWTTEATEEAFRRHLRAAALDAQNRAAVWGGAKTIARAKKMTELVERIENRMNAVAFARQDQKAWQKVMQYAPGTAGGALRGAAKLGQLTITPIQRLAQAAVKQQQAVTEAAEQTIKVLTGAAAPRALKAAVSARNILASVNRARALQDPNSPESARLRQATNELAHDDPNFANVMAAKEQQKAAFIASKAGPAVDNSDPFGAKPAPMDRITAGKLERYVAAVEDPGAALKRLANGQGTAEDLEAVQTVYPRLYESFAQLVQQQMARAKVPPTTRQRQQLYQATGIPMAREQQPDYVAWAQRMAQAEQEGEAPPEQAGLAVAASRQGMKDIDLKPDEHYGNKSDQVLAGGP